MSTFECKDCGEVFPNAELFVYHVDTCTPAKSQLQQAIDLLNAAAIKGKRVTRQDSITHEDVRMDALDRVLDNAYHFLKKAKKFAREE